MVVGVLFTHVGLEQHFAGQRGVMDFLLIVLFQRVRVDITDGAACG